MWPSEAGEGAEPCPSLPRTTRPWTICVSGRYLLQARATDAASQGGFPTRSSSASIRPRAKIAGAVDPQALRDEAANLTPSTC